MYRLNRKRGHGAGAQHFMKETVSFWNKLYFFYIMKYFLREFFEFIL